MCQQILSIGIFADGSNSQYIRNGNVRIGLIYSKNPADYVEVSSEKGMIIGETSQSDDFSMLFDYEGKLLRVMKNVYYEKKDTEFRIISHNNVLSENWHIKIGGEVSSFKSAQELVDFYKSIGLDTFTYYDGKWNLIYGIYDYFEAADYEKQLLSKKYPELTFVCIKPDINSLMISDDKGNPFMVYNHSEYKFIIKPNNKDFLKMNNDIKKVYRGEFSIKRENDGIFTLINILNIEEYLYGVLPAEIGGGAPIEACKAQAVAARNYTLNNIGKHQKEGFDLCNTTDCQVYKGKNLENDNTNRAVEETKGKLLKYGGKNAQVFYFSSTGGVPTEDVENVWGASIPYLKSVDSSMESKKSYNATWVKDYTKAQIKEFLLNRKTDLGDITEILVTKRSEAGRVIELKIKGTIGEKLFLRESVRTVLKLDSQYYDFKTDADIFVKTAEGTKKTTLAGKKVATANGYNVIGYGDKTATVKGFNSVIKKNVSPQKFLFSGKGWGHGVGLSQEGAIAMAKAGMSYDKILTHYFPGTNIN
jgi:stage II sporulation protein D